MWTNVVVSTAARGRVELRKLVRIIVVLGAALIVIVTAFGASAEAQYYHGRYGYHGRYYGGGHYYRGYYGGHHGGYYGHRYGYYGARYGYYGGRYNHYRHGYGYYGGYGPHYYGGYYRPRYYSYYGPRYYSDWRDTNYYSEPSYYSDDYRGDGDAVDYCMQRFISYDPDSGTYIGFDGFVHTCP